MGQSHPTAGAARFGLAVFLAAVELAPSQGWSFISVGMITLGAFFDREVLRRTLVNRTYGETKTYIFINFYQQYLVLFTIVSSVIARFGLKKVSE